MGISIAKPFYHLKMPGLLTALILIFLVIMVTLARRPLKFRHLPTPIRPARGLTMAKEVTLNWQIVHGYLTGARIALRFYGHDPDAETREPIGPLLLDKFGINADDPYLLWNLYESSLIAGREAKKFVESELKNPAALLPADVPQLIAQVLLARATFDMRLSKHIPPPYLQEPGRQRVTIPQLDPESWPWHALCLSRQQLNSRRDWKQAVGSLSPDELEEQNRIKADARDKFTREPLKAFCLLTVLHLFVGMYRLGNQRSKEPVPPDRFEKLAALLLGGAYELLPSDYKILVGLKR
jgi:hypothetical protein